MIVPWTIYRTYGDTRIVERHYDAMARWMEYLREANPDLSAEPDGQQLRRLALPEGRSHAQGPPRHGLLGLRRELWPRWPRPRPRRGRKRSTGTSSSASSRAFNEAYVAPDGRIEGDTQTCYLLALHMDLLPEELRPAAAEHLVRT